MGLEIEDLIELLGDSQFLCKDDEVVDFPFGLLIELRLDLVEKHEITIEHLKAVNEVVGWGLLQDDDGVLSADDDLMRLNVCGYLEAVDLKFGLCD